MPDKSFGLSKESVEKSNLKLKRIIEKMIQGKGTTIAVTVMEGTFLVPRRYIALHGLKADEVARLGFERVNC